jgi:hypothetical protein
MVRDDEDNLEEIRKVYPHMTDAKLRIGRNNPRRYVAWLGTKTVIQTHFAAIRVSRADSTILQSSFRSVRLGLTLSVSSGCECERVMRQHFS